jgi:hypothetical protein
MTSTYHEKKRKINLEPMCLEGPPQKRIKIHPIRTLLAVLTLTILLFLPFLPAQNPAELAILSLDLEPKVPEWINYGGKVHKIIETVDGGLAILCSIDEDSIIFKTNKQGEIIWQQSYLAFGNYIGFIQTNDGGFVFLIEFNEEITINQSIYIRYGILVKTDVKGILQDVKLYEYEKTSETVCFCLIGLYQSADGVLVLQSSKQEGVLIQKIDFEGEMQESIIQSPPERFIEMIPTYDGGYVLLGSRDITEFEEEYILMKVDSNLIQEWDMKIGTLRPEHLIQMQDETYLISGTAGEGIQGGEYPCILSVNTNGTVLFEQSMESVLRHVGYPWARRICHILETVDGGLAILTSGNLIGADSIGLGGYGVALVKTSSVGVRTWARDYYPSTTQKTGCDLKGSTLTQLEDGGYVIAGSITYDSGYFKRYIQQVKPFIMRTDELGNQLWNQTFTGPLEDEWVTNVIRTKEGGVAVAGYTNSYGEGDQDMWVVKTDDKGNVEWEKVVGGEEDDLTTDLLQTKDGGMILSGNTKSISSSIQKMWLGKLDENGELLWQRTYGEERNETIQRMIQTADGGLMIGGTTTSNTTGRKEMCLLKLDDQGTTIWRKTYICGNESQITDIIQTADNGFIFSGITSLNNQLSEYADIFGCLTKINSKGKIEWQHALNQFPNGYYNQTGSAIHALGEYQEEIIVFGEQLVDTQGWCGYSECEQHPTFLMKIDLEGKLIQNSETEIRCGPYSWVSFFKFLDMQVQTNGELVIAGSANRYAVDYKVWMLDRNGSIIDEITYPGTAKYSTPYIKAITTDNNGKLIVAADVYVRSAVGVSLDSWIAKSDEFGIIQWYQTYGHVGFHQTDPIRKPILTSKTKTDYVGTYSQKTDTSALGLTLYTVSIAFIVLLPSKRYRKKK